MTSSSTPLKLSPTTMATANWSAVNRRYRRIEERDLEHLRRWRNEQQDVLRQQAPIDRDHQLRWWSDVIRPSYEITRPSSFLVVCDGAPTPTSYGGLTNIDWVSGRGELSFLADSEIAADEPRYAAEFGAFLTWIIEFSFDELGFRRLFTETWSFRETHMRILESAGLQPEGRLRSHVVKDGVAYDALIHGILSNDQRPA